MLPLIQKQTECFEKRDWECVGRTTDLFSGLTATRWRVISDHELVDKSVQTKVDEFLAWHESLPSDKFEVTEPATNVERTGKSAEESLSLSEVLRPTPYFVNGRQIGYRVYPGSNPEIFDVSGLKVGDLVTQIDRQSLEDPGRAFEYLKRIASGESIEVTVERNGQPETIELEIKPPEGE